MKGVPVQVSFPSGRNIYPNLSQALRQSNMACWKCTIDDFPFNTFVHRGFFHCHVSFPEGRDMKENMGCHDQEKQPAELLQEWGNPFKNNSEQQLSWGKWSSKPLDLGFSILSSLCWGFYRTHFFHHEILGFSLVFPMFLDLPAPARLCNIVRLNTFGSACSCNRPCLAVGAMGPWMSWGWGEDIWRPGWWYTYPSGKYDESSVGIMTFPIYGKIPCPNHQPVWRHVRFWTMNYGKKNWGDDEHW